MKKVITAARAVCQNAMPRGVPPAVMAIFCSEKANPQPVPIAKSRAQGNAFGKKLVIGTGFLNNQAIVSKVKKLTKELIARATSMDLCQIALRHGFLARPIHSN